MVLRSARTRSRNRYDQALPALQLGDLLTLFVHEYQAGFLANTGQWQFEWTWRDGRPGHRSLVWRVRHSTEDRWRLEEVEPGYAIDGEVNDDKIKEHITNALAMSEAARKDSTHVPLKNGGRFRLYAGPDLLTAGARRQLVIVAGTPTGVSMSLEYYVLPARVGESLKHSSSSYGGMSLDSALDLQVDTLQDALDQQMVAEHR